MDPQMPLDRKYIALIGALALSACGETAEPPAPIISPPPVVSTPQAPAPLPEPEETFRPDLNQIHEATPAEVQNYVGAPTLVRRDETVQVMTFETDRCVFQVVFYEATQGAPFNARHISARDRAGNDTEVEACLTDVMAQN